MEELDAEVGQVRQLASRESQDEEWLGISVYKLDVHFVTKINSLELLSGFILRE